LLTRSSLPSNTAVELAPLKGGATLSVRARL
jgi:hypothetical protein